LTTPRPRSARRTQLPVFFGVAAIALLAPALSTTAAIAAPAPDADATTISRAGAFTQTIPDGVCSVNVTIAGAPGGLAIADGDAEPDPDNPGSMRGANGAGGLVSATLAVGAGSILTGQVGSAGSNGGAAGAPGGGTGGTGTHPGGGGGGYTELSFGGDLLLLAAGGGGTGGGHTPDFGHGGDGGFDLSAGVAILGGTVFPGGDGSTGQDLGAGEDTPTAPGAGIGGSTAGGLGGVNPRSQTDPGQPGFNWDATAGAALQGGNGGPDNYADTGGAGGGGFFGGGGGASTDGEVGSGGVSFVGGGGGGGSSYAADSALIGDGSLALAKNRDAEGAADGAFVTFEWVMCAYDLSVSKTVVGNPVYEDGATVRYAVTVTNNGGDDMAVGDTISLVDDLAAGGTLVSVDGLSTSVPAAGETIPATGIEAYDLVDIVGADPDAPATQRERGLASGASVEFVYDVVVAGTEPVTNTVSVADRGDQSNNAAQATIAPAAPALSLTKSADETKVTTVGQKVTYSFVVTNVGNIDVRDISIDEQEFSGHGTLPDPTCPAGAIAPGNSLTCTAEYTVVAADLTGAALTNTATAAGATPLGNPVESTEASADVTTVKPPVRGALAVTGGGDGTWYLAGGAALLIAGLGLMAARRGTAKARR
jgi:hypothetical protein